MARDRDVREDAAGTGPQPDRGVRLMPMGELRDFRIAKGEPDVRGWEVRTLSGRSIGRVDDLLVDPEAGEVVMLDIDIDDADRHAVAPLRVAQLDRDRKIVILDSAEVDRGGSLPTYGRGRQGEHPDDRDNREFGERYRRAYQTEGERDADYDVRRGGDGEVVIERRPVVVEEVVVRRKRVEDEDEPERR
jgi:sporulation protein YlmC with PRC-barrel domain